MLASQGAGQGQEKDRGAEAQGFLSLLVVLVPLRIGHFLAETEAEWIGLNKCP
jgi:hypothetical protein